MQLLSNASNLETQICEFIGISRPFSFQQVGKTETCTLFMSQVSSETAKSLSGHHGGDRDNEEMDPCLTDLSVWCD